jgi:hypothetical protein
VAGVSHHPPTPRPGEPAEPQLDAQSRALVGRGAGFGLIGAVVAIPGIVLVILTQGWAYDLGWVLIVLGCLPGMVSLGLLLSGAVAHRAARHEPFA